VNQTDAFLIADRGFEWANGLCDIPADPANWEATAAPRNSIDSCCNQSTYPRSIALPLTQLSRSPPSQQGF
jgi:hypothetical protein